ncbi:MAG: carbohydrate ABC transporter permease [Lachnospirales bacterium]
MYKGRRIEILSKRSVVARRVVSIALVIYVCITFFVLALIGIDSLKEKSDLITNFIGLPKKITFQNYITIFTEENFLLYAKNSFILTVFGTGGCIFLSSMVAYGIARYDFKWKNITILYFMLGLMVPIQVTILPVFLILTSMNLTNKLLGILLVYISGISMSCFIFQKFFKTIPIAVEESAKLDGASDFRTFFQIMMPMAKPVLFTMGLITSVGIWNDFYLPMVLLSKKSVRTLTLLIFQYTGQFTRYMSESMAAVVITLIPVIIIYFLFNTQLVEGITSGSVKE